MSRHLLPGKCLPLWDQSLRRGIGWAAVKMPCMRRPITGRRGGIAEHLYKAGFRAQSGQSRKLDIVKDGLKKGLKYAVGGAVFYFAVSLALGGRDRVQHDLEVLKVRDMGALCASLLRTCKEA